MAFTDLPQQGQDRLRPSETTTSVVAAEAPNPLGPVPRPVLAGEHTHRQRLVRDQGDPQLPAGIQHPIHLRLPMQQGVLDLVGGKGNPPLGQRRMGDAELPCGIVAHPDCPDLPRLHGVGHQPHERGDRDATGREVVLVQIDAAAPEPSKALIQRIGERFCR